MIMVLNLILLLTYTYTIFQYLSPLVKAGTLLEGNENKMHSGDGRLQQTGQNIHVVFDSGPFAPLCENTMSSTQVHVITALPSE